MRMRLYEKDKVFIVGQDFLVRELFKDNGFVPTSFISEAELVVFTGGADVSPFLYGQTRHPFTESDYNRDMMDIKMLRLVQPHQSLIGICRGAQFLNVMIGNGTLYQHVDNHASGPHLVESLENPAHQFMVTSTHHQMMRPSKHAQLLLGARHASTFYMQGNTPVRTTKLTDRHEPTYPLDAEAVYLPSLHTPCDGALLVQGHPEYPDANTTFKQWFFEQIEDKFNYDLDK